MQRIEIFKLLYATNEILGSPEMKGSLNAKQIYLVSKLNNKLESINKVTGKRQGELQDSYRKATMGDVTEEAKKDLTEVFNADWKVILEDEVDNPVEVKLPFESSEKILQHINKSDVTQAVIQYLIEEPLAEMKVV